MTLSQYGVRTEKTSSHVTGQEPVEAEKWDSTLCRLRVPSGHPRISAYLTFKAFQRWSSSSLWIWIFGYWSSELKQLDYGRIRLDSNVHSPSRFPLHVLWKNVPLKWEISVIWGFLGACSVSQCSVSKILCCTIEFSNSEQNQSVHF